MDFLRSKFKDLRRRLSRKKNLPGSFFEEPTRPQPMYPGMIPPSTPPLSNTQGNTSYPENGGNDRYSLLPEVVHSIPTEKKALQTAHEGPENVFHTQAGTPSSIDTTSQYPAELQHTQGPNQPIASNVLNNGATATIYELDSNASSSRIASQGPEAPSNMQGPQKPASHKESSTPPQELDGNPSHKSAENLPSQPEDREASALNIKDLYPLSLLDAIRGEFTESPIETSLDPFNAAQKGKNGSAKSADDDDGSESVGKAEEPEVFEDALDKQNGSIPTAPTPHNSFMAATTVTSNNSSNQGKDHQKEQLHPGVNSTSETSK
ncbi:hypothetical protein H4219_005717 [Mycoemilia scoparia]|uniref:Uncharacterized protein n=1 Tax=Mycoemilia scoparia TaxID=417184 RepID=A0A9W7ZTG3_9FUNG|nr:hypothetical protein H4219_005717 [Mycoemilia scoparia]